ncbi:MAG: group II truncated hemoglobin [bacterium]
MDEPNSTLYEDLGGADVLRRIVDLFYDEMDQNPEMAVIRQMHPADLTTSRDKLFMFLSGWTGGPNLYWETYGHPRLRARHMPFAIGDREAIQWLACMDVALMACVSPSVYDQLMGAFKHMAGHMRNRVTD